MRKFSKLAYLLGLSTFALALGACDKIQEVVNPVEQSQQAQPAQSTPAAETPAQASANEIATPAESADAGVFDSDLYSVTDYLKLPDELKVPQVYVGNYKESIPNYNVASTVYKNFLYNLANLESTPRATNLLNELYVYLSDVKSVPNAELVIFYIDTFRNLEGRIQTGLDTLKYSVNVQDNRQVVDMTAQQKVQFLSTITNEMDKVVDSFFATHQFLTQNDIELPQNIYTEEYERYQQLIRLSKQQNQALIQHDITCTNNYRFAGDMVNCLQQKYAVEFAALDTQLLNTFQNYLVNDKVDEKGFVQQNLLNLQRNKDRVLQKNYESYFRHLQLLDGKEVK